MPTAYIIYGTKTQKMLKCDFDVVGYSRFLELFGKVVGEACSQGGSCGLHGTPSVDLSYLLNYARVRLSGFSSFCLS